MSTVTLQALTRVPTTRSVSSRPRGPDDIAVVVEDGLGFLPVWLSVMVAVLLGAGLDLVGLGRVAGGV